jgi:uncharacterized protein YdaU (DUF1376 family)
MNKKSFYFSHDYNSRSDPKLMKLSMRMGMEGLGIYWCLVEMLYEQKGFISLDNIEPIAFELHSDCECIKNVLQDFNLFKFKDDKFFSESILRRLRERKNKSESAKKSAEVRWNRDNANNANAMRTQCERNAIKERKGKDIKEKKRRVNNRFIPPVLEEVKSYFKENGYTEQSALRAFDHYALANWYDTKGSPVRNWKQKMHTVWFTDENKINNHSGESSIDHMRRIMQEEKEKAMRDGN